MAEHRCDVRARGRPMGVTVRFVGSGDSAVGAVSDLHPGRRALVALRARLRRVVTGLRWRSRASTTTRPTPSCARAFTAITAAAYRPLLMTAPLNRGLSLASSGPADRSRPIAGRPTIPPAESKYVAAR